jgi:hypothetical protein
VTARTKGSSRPAGRPLSNEDRQALRRAGAEDARRSRARQGLPERIEDPVTAAALAALLRDRARPAPHTAGQAGGTDGHQRHNPARTRRGRPGQPGRTATAASAG